MKNLIWIIITVGLILIISLLIFKLQPPIGEYDIFQDKELAVGENIPSDVVPVFSSNADLNSRINQGYEFYRKKNYREALRVFEALEKDEKNWSPLFLGSLYYQGEGVKQDKEKAVSFLTTSANGGNKYAQSALGALLLFDKDCKFDENGLYYLLSAAAEKESQAAYNLGQIYWQGLLDIPRDYVKAIYWLNQAADLNNSDALLTLACIYMDGKIIPRDDQQAFKLIIRASKLCNPNAFLILYQIHLEGMGKIKPNPGKAYEYLTIAAELGDPEAQTLRGLFDIVRNDRESAAKWLKKAEAQGYKHEAYIEKFLAGKLPKQSHRCGEVVWDLRQTRIELLKK